jgi:hypothetical protein
MELNGEAYCSNLVDARNPTTRSLILPVRPESNLRAPKVGMAHSGVEIQFPKYMW